MPPPTVVKPQPLWTGKQVITTILNHIIKEDQKLNLGNEFVYSNA